MRHTTVGIATVLKLPCNQGQPSARGERKAKPAPHANDGLAAKERSLGAGRAVGHSPTLTISRARAVHAAAKADVGPGDPAAPALPLAMMGTQERLCIASHLMKHWQACGGGDRHVTQALADWVEHSKEASTLDWLLASFKDLPRKPVHGRQNDVGFDFHAVGRAIAALNESHAVTYLTRAASILEGCSGQQRDLSDDLWSLCEGLTCAPLGPSRDALFSRLAEVQERLRARADCQDDYALQYKDYVAETRDSFTLTNAPGRLNQSRSVRTFDDIRKSLARVEIMYAPFTGVGEASELADIFADVLHTDNAAFMEEIDARVIATYQTSYSASSSALPKLQAHWAGIKARAANKIGHHLAASYFDEALRGSYVGGAGCASVVMTLSGCVDRTEPQQSRQLRGLLKYLDDFPQAPAFASSYVFATLAKRGLLANITAMDAHDVYKHLDGLVDARYAEPLYARLSHSFGANHHLETFASRFAKDQTFAAYVACVPLLGEGYAAFVATLLTVSVSRGTPSPAVMQAVLALAEHLNNTEKCSLVAYLFAHPELAGRIAEHFCAQKSIDLKRHGDSHDTFQSFAAMLLAGDRFTPPDTRHRQAPESTLETRAVAVAPNNVFTEMAGEHWVAYGRTLYGSGADGVRMALKLPKHGNEEELHYEASMMGVMAGMQAQIGLRSSLPQPIGMTPVVLTQPIIRAIDQQAEIAGQKSFTQGSAGSRVAGLLYLPPKDYERYLHQAKNELELREASSRCLHDVAVMARHGWLFDAPADLFHNTDHGAPRAYHWNVGQLNAAVGGRFGAGRLERSERAIQFPNYGVSGVRDAKQFKPIDSVAKGSKNMAGNEVVALMTRLGDMQFAWALSVARWYQSQNRLDDDAGIAETLHLGMSEFFAAHTGRDLQACRAFLAALVDWRRCARQIGYFCSQDYMADIAQDTVRPGIYHPAVQVAAAKPQDNTWSDALGWAANGQDRDLGPHNGPFPITELIRALYLLTSSAVTLAGQAQRRDGDDAARPVDDADLS